jgi:hypothetical protein
VAFISRRVVAYTAVLALLAPTLSQAAPAGEKVFWSNRNDGWSGIKIYEGCYLIHFRDSLVNGWGGYGAALDVKINGECGPDGLAEGPVSIQFTFPASQPSYDGRRYNNLIQITGTARNGVLEGNAEETVADDLDGDFALSDMGDVRNPMPLFYRSGCEYSDDGNGNYIYPSDEACTVDGIMPMIAQLFEAGMIEAPLDNPSASGSGSGYSSPPPPPQNTDSGASGDVWGRCITLRSEPKRGIQDYWSLYNSCSKNVIARYCFQPGTAAAGDPNLCMRREYRTHEIKAGRKLDFAFSLIDEDQAMSDGTSAGPSTLTVHGFACTDERFPDVYFDNGEFKSFGC